MKATAVVNWLKKQCAPEAHLCLDSRVITPGDVFFACPGLVSDGHAYIDQAIAAGAAAVVQDAAGAMALDVPTLQVEGLSQLLGEIAHEWYGKPSAQMTTIAITGTNGKTSSVQWLAAMLNNSGIACGTIGTLGVTLPDGSNLGGVLTTPDVLTMHRSLAAIHQAGANLVALEASSIGLEQGRLDHVEIDVAALTNLSHDHLDYHHTTENYKNAKQILFNWPHLRLAVVNKDDAFGRELLTTAKAARILSYSILDKSADLYADDVHTGGDGQVFNLIEAHGTAQILTRLLGDHNVSNLLLVSAILLELGWPIAKIARLMATLGPVPGRLQIVRSATVGTHRPLPLVVVDYAHTPDALERALLSLRDVAKVRNGKVTCVFGCGGDRDTAKRPLMGEIAERLADKVIITTDNSRSENPADIAKQIQSGMKAESAYLELDRAKAILQAVWSAEPSDIVLIAGKGHETYQEIQGQRSVFDDTHWGAFALTWLRGVTLSTDTRSIQPGQIFAAISGDRFDGHDYLQTAKEKGAAMALVSHAVDVDIAQFVLGDVQTVLTKVATLWRQRFPIPVVAVTGSNGKTTTKEMIAAIFTEWLGADSYLATAGNLNNQLGVPLSVLRLAPQHKAAVFELGMNHPGEIAPLAAVAAPTIALVNNAQREHQEYMHSVDAVAAENGMVLSALTEQGVAIFPADDHYSSFWKELAGDKKTVCFGFSQDAIVRADDIHADPTVTRFRLFIDKDSGAVHLPVPGVHNLRNALAAAACAYAAGAPLASIIKGLESFKAVAGRMQLKHLPNGMQLIDDSYNANPDSVRAAIDVLSQLPGKKILVLGNMAEVGINSGAVHSEVGAYAREHNITTLFVLGQDAKKAAEAFGSESSSFDDLDQLIEQLLLAMPAQVLVKGSRSARMERVVEALENHFTENHHAS